MMKLFEIIGSLVIIGLIIGGIWWIPSKIQLRKARAFLETLDE